MNERKTSRRDLRQLRADFTAGEASMADVLGSCRAWEAHAAQGDTRALLVAIHDEARFCRSSD